MALLKRQGNRVEYTWVEGDTVGKVLRRTAERHWNDNSIAYRQKKLGIWQEYTWKQHYENAKYFALGLMTLGLQPKDKVFIIGNPSPDAFALTYGSAAIGAIVAITYPMTRRDEVKYIVNHSDSKIIIAEDQEQVDKILEMRQESPEEFSNVLKMIYWNPKGMWNYNDSFLMSYQQILDLGRRFEATQPNLFDDTVNAVQSDDILALNYTSGTTGWPKGGIWTHKGTLQSIAQWMAVKPYYTKDEGFSFIALDVSINSLPALIAGIPINLPEAVDTIPRDLREIGWTVGGLLGIEQLASEMKVRIKEATFLERLSRLPWTLFKPVGLRKAAAMAEGENLNLIWKTLYGLGYFFVFKPLRDRYGLLQARDPFVTAVAINPEVLKLFSGIGVHVRNSYNQTECQPITMTTTGSADSDTVGPPVPGREVRLSGEGEILARGACATGYYKNPEATAKYIDSQRWVHTGDAGFVTPHGRIIILDMIAHLMKLGDGTEFSPLWIESKLKFSPYIRHAIITGNGKDFVGTLISIDSTFVKNWAEENQIPYASYADLSQKPEVYELIKGDIEKRVNKALPPKTRLQKFALLPKEMDIDDAELTRTFKLRRGYVAERYKDFIEALYTDKSEHFLDLESTYEDGRKQRIQTRVVIAKLENEE